jgi:hypothetical protein
MQELKDFELYILNKIIENTDFQKIHTMMNSVEWGWITNIESINIITPDIKTIEHTARQLIHLLLLDIRHDKEYHYHERGGLFVWYNQYNSDKWYENIILDFRLNTTIYLNENEIKEVERMEKISKLLDNIK